MTENMRCFMCKCELNEHSPFTVFMGVHDYQIYGNNNRELWNFCLSCVENIRQDVATKDTIEFKLAVDKTVKLILPSLKLEQSRDIQTYIYRWYMSMNMWQRLKWAMGFEPRWLTNLTDHIFANNISNLPIPEITFK